MAGRFSYGGVVCGKKGKRDGRASGCVSKQLKGTHMYIRFKGAQTLGRYRDVGCRTCQPN